MFKKFGPASLFFIGLIAAIISNSLLLAEESQVRAEALQMQAERLQMLAEQLQTRAKELQMQAEGLRASPEKPKKYTLCVSTVFKDGSCYLKEWIEYHRLVGVDHFYLYDNESTDNPKAILDPYIEQGIVTLTYWPDRESETWQSITHTWVDTTQVPAFEHACKTSVEDTKWIALIDSDEFLVPVKVDKMTDLLEKYKDYSGITMLWQMYGTSNVPSLPPNTLLIEVLHRTSPPDHSFNTTAVKCIIKPECYNGFSWAPHQPIYKDGQRGIELKKDEVQINHYRNRTVDFFYANKIRDKEKIDHVKLSEDAINQFAQVGNEVEDELRIIQRFVPALRKRMGFDP